MKVCSNRLQNLKLKPQTQTNTVRSCSNRLKMINNKRPLEITERIYESAPKKQRVPTFYHPIEPMELQSSSFPPEFDHLVIQHIYLYLLFDHRACARFAQVCRSFYLVHSELRYCEFSADGEKFMLFKAFKYNRKHYYYLPFCFPENNYVKNREFTTIWNAIELDPKELRINTMATKFGYTKPFYEYGFLSSYGQGEIAAINLLGTPFTVDKDQFQGAKFGHNNQVIYRDTPLRKDIGPWLQLKVLHKVKFHKQN
jgi:hypothetical protein